MLSFLKHAVAQLQPINRVLFFFRFFVETKHAVISNDREKSFKHARSLCMIGKISPPYLRRNDIEKRYLFETTCGRSAPAY